MVTLPCFLPFIQTECSQKKMGADFKMSGAPYRVRRGAKVNTAPGLIRLHWAQPLSQSQSLLIFPKLSLLCPAESRAHWNYHEIYWCWLNLDINVFWEIEKLDSGRIILMRTLNALSLYLIFKSLGSWSLRVVTMCVQARDAGSVQQNVRTAFQVLVWDQVCWTGRLRTLTRPGAGGEARWDKLIET